MRLTDFPPEPRIVEMSYPTKVVFGIGALKRLPAEVERLKMTKALLVTEGGVVKSGLAERAIAVLRAEGISFTVFDSVRPDPTEQDALEGVAAYRRSGCDGLIAIGGGSPLDTAKLIDLLVTHEPPLSRYDDAAGGDSLTCRDLPPPLLPPAPARPGP